MENNEKITMKSENPARDWTEDFNYENGNYQCRCMDCDNTFFGHKRRVQCKLCSTDNLSSLKRKRQIAIDEGASRTLIADFDYAIKLIEEYRKSNPLP